MIRSWPALALLLAGTAHGQPIPDFLRDGAKLPGQRAVYDGTSAVSATPGGASLRVHPGGGELIVTVLEDGPPLRALIDHGGVRLAVYAAPDAFLQVARRRSVLKVGGDA